MNETITLQEAVTILQQNTMACWWPSRISGEVIDKAGIMDEAKLLLKGIMARQDIPWNESFFVLDDSNPESKLYDEIMEAMLVFDKSIGV